MPRDYRETDVQIHRCDPDVGGCGENVETRVAIHRLTGVAGFTCPGCGKTQEPNPVGERPPGDRV